MLTLDLSSRILEEETRIATAKMQLTELVYIRELAIIFNTLVRNPEQYEEESPETKLQAELLFRNLCARHEIVVPETIDWEEINII